MSQPHPRDLHGYGRNAAAPTLIGRRRIAAQFVPNDEEGGENLVLHGDGASGAFLSGSSRRNRSRAPASHMNMESL